MNNKKLTSLGEPDNPATAPPRTMSTISSRSPRVRTSPALGRSTASSTSRPRPASTASAGPPPTCRGSAALRRPSSGIKHLAVNDNQGRHRHRRRQHRRDRQLQQRRLDDQQPDQREQLAHRRAGHGTRSATRAAGRLLGQREGRRPSTTRSRRCATSSRRLAPAAAPRRPCRKRLHASSITSWRP